MFRLKEIMDKKGISNKELAARMKMTPVSISYLVTGKTEPNVSKIQTLAKALGVSDWELFVNPDDFLKDNSTLACPHCGKPIHIRLEP